MHPLDQDTATPETASVRVGLQRIFDADRQTVAYELLFRAPGAVSANLSGTAEHDRATATVITSTFSEFGAHAIADGHTLFLNTTRAFLIGDLPLPFPPDGVVLELLETVAVDDALLEGLQSLRARGYQIAVDDFDGEPARVRALPLAAYVKIDLQVTGERIEQVIALVRALSPDAAVIVERVETEEQFEQCRALGIEFFQGYHLHRPIVVERRTLSTSRVACVNLLAALHDDDTAIEDVIHRLTQNAALSMRVLRTVSSAAYAPREGITSLHRAVALLGRRELGNWIVLLLLGGSGTVSPHDQELLVGIFTRATACRLLAPDAPQTAFTVGLLSGAAEALQVPPAELLDGCVVDTVIRDALLDGVGPIGGVLRAVRAYAEILDAPTIGSDSTPRNESVLADSSPTGCGASSVPEVSSVYLRSLTSARATVSTLQV